MEKHKGSQMQTDTLKKKKGFGHLPNVHFFRHWLVAYDLWSHPGHRPREGHLGALVAEFFGRAKVRNLHRVVIGDQHAVNDVCLCFSTKTATEVLFLLTE